jgi:hypothetical protein
MIGAMAEHLKLARKTNVQYVPQFRETQFSVTNFSWNSRAPASHIIGSHWQPELIAVHPHHAH